MLAQLSAHMKRPTEWIIGATISALIAMVCSYVLPALIPSYAAKRELRHSGSADVVAPVHELARGLASISAHSSAQASRKTRGTIVVIAVAALIVVSLTFYRRAR
jgi:hypothetical protein